MRIPIGTGTLEDLQVFWGNAISTRYYRPSPSDEVSSLYNSLNRHQANCRTLLYGARRCALTFKRESDLSTTQIATDRSPCQLTVFSRTKADTSPEIDSFVRRRFCKSYSDRVYDSLFNIAIRIVVSIRMTILPTLPSHFFLSWWASK